MSEQKATVTETGVPLSRLLLQMGILTDQRCGGRGTCGRCRVRVLSGLWEEAGNIVAAPAFPAACRTVLRKGPGVVELPSPEEAESETPPPVRVPYPDLAVPVVALDIGTTTVVGALLVHGRIQRCVKMANAQRLFGDNVIDRITAASRGEGAALQQAVRFSLGKVIAALDVPEGASFSLAANTVMLALLCGTDPSSLGVSPFRVPEMDLSALSPSSLGWHGEGKVFVLPPVSAYLGGDVTAGWKETDLAPGEMLADIGTNCEILYYSEKKGLIGTSAAAGPAFEGGGIACGSRLRHGVISHLPAPRMLQVSGGGRPQGISGTALVDWLFWARKMNEIDRCGKWRDDRAQEIAPGLAISDEETARLLTAKAAIYAGIVSLERFAGTPAKRIFLAGDFAAHLSLERAVAIGMLPGGRELLTVGNTALAGALRYGCEAVMGRESIPAGTLPQEIRPNELPDFPALFAEGMLLPETMMK